MFDVLPLAEKSWFLLSALAPNVRCSACSPVFVAEPAHRDVYSTVRYGLKVGRVFSACLLEEDGWTRT